MKQAILANQAYIFTSLNLINSMMMILVHSLSLSVGKYVCAKCDHDLFSSNSKYKHSSPWPAFTETIREDSLQKYEESPGALKVGGTVWKVTNCIMMAPVFKISNHYCYRVTYTGPISHVSVCLSHVFGVWCLKLAGPTGNGAG